MKKGNNYKNCFFYLLKIETTIYKINIHAHTYTYSYIHTFTQTPQNQIK